MTPGQLRLIRKRLGMTQAELAHAIGMSLVSVARMEAGVQPIAKRTGMAVKALGVAKTAEQAS